MLRRHDVMCVRPKKQAVTNLLEELGHGCATATPVECDSRGAIAVSNRDTSTQRTRHIARRHKWVIQLQQDKIVDLLYTATDKIAADVLTKALPAPAFRVAVRALRLLPGP